MSRTLESSITTAIASGDIEPFFAFKWLSIPQHYFYIQD